jgi:PST family polysaccharide transporter
LQRDDSALKRAFYASAGISAAVALPLYAGLGVLTPQAVHIVFGLKWEKAAPVMQAGMAQAITAFTHPLLIALGKVRDELRWNMGACLVLMLGFAASVHFGIIAVAWSLAAASVALIPARLFLMWRVAGTSTRSYLSRMVGPTVATIGMIAGVLLFGDQINGAQLILHFASEIVVGAVIYLALLLLLDWRTARLIFHVFRSLHR